MKVIVLRSGRGGHHQRLVFEKNGHDVVVIDRQPASGLKPASPMVRSSGVPIGTWARPLRP